MALISSLFIAVLLLSNILSVKLVRIGFLVFDGGTILFPLSYIFSDILTEVYGYKIARKVMWTGIATLLLMSLSIWCIGILPPSSSWKGQESYNTILGQVPRIVLGSIMGFWAGSYSNSVVLSRLKIVTGGRWLWTRTIGSTLVGQFADTFIFVLVAFWATTTVSEISKLILSNYIFKVAVEIAMTPFTYRVVACIKKRESIDVFDHGIRYNPLPLGK